jgi:hypothetical protein
MKPVRRKRRKMMRKMRRKMRRKSWYHYPLCLNER